jgi:hypothetical protein
MILCFCFNWICDLASVFDDAIVDLYNGPSSRLRRASRMAKLLPLPVSERTSISLPVSMAGINFFCVVVGVVMLNSLRSAVCNDGCKPNV